MNAAPGTLTARSVVGAVFDGPGALPVAAVVALVCGYIQFTSMINHDVAWFLYSVQAWFDGGRLYRDVFFEVNPPLALYLTVPPVFVSQLLGVPAPLVFTGYIFALIAFSLWLTRRLLTRQAGLSDAARRGILFSALLALALCPAGDFGQREHIMVILALPYLVLTAQRVNMGACPPLLAASLGLMAGLGFALKPYFLLLPIALEIHLLLVGRQLARLLRPETFGLAGAGLLYGLTLVWFTPDYLTQVVPFALEVFQQGFMGSPAVALWRLETLFLPVLVVLHLATRRSSRIAVLADVFVLAAACLFLSYLLQMKAWSYQLYPTTASMVLAFGAILFGGRKADAGPSPTGRRGRIVRAAAPTAAAMLLILAAVGVLRGGYQSEFVERLAPVVRKHASGGAIYIFSSNVSAAFPLVNETGVRWASRFPMQWLVPGLVRRRANLAQQGAAAPEGLREVERYTRDAVVADLTRWPAALIMVDDRRDKSYFGGFAFDYLEFYSADPRFARILARYEKIDRIGDYDVYRLRRTP